MLLATLTLFLLGMTAVLRAQVPEPTPTPDPHSYTDPAMNFTAPPEAYLMGRREVDVRQLGQDLEPIARWVVRPGKENAAFIDLSMEGYDGPPDQWEARFESQTHGGGSGVLIKNKTPMSLLNGMPATFVEVTTGEGFDSRKEYAVVWGDGARGVVLSVTARMGDVSADEAKAMLKNVTAVRYPNR
ncbi:MAG TPA: hypothetical protein VKB39_06640 [Candidatus Baltobacteraceae bacterium]|nr:hypothetical protein [Candidatus Baltobacteraceae bacterium]